MGKRKQVNEIVTTNFRQTFIKKSELLLLSFIIFIFDNKLFNINKLVIFIMFNVNKSIIFNHNNNILLLLYLFLVNYLNRPYVLGKILYLVSINFLTLEQSIWFDICYQF